MASFTAGPDGVHARLEEHEADLLRQLTKEMRTLLEADIPPSDDVMTRLFPAAYEDREMQRAYADLVESELRQAKAEALRLVDSALGMSGEVEKDLTDGDAHAWLTLLTDLRLAIGTRLDVTEEKMAAEPDPSSTDAAAYSVLHWLGWLQEMLLESLGSGPRFEASDEVNGL